MNLADLTPDPKNRRKHNARNVEMLQEALSKVGAARSIVIDETGEILAGNGLVQAASALGLSKVQVVDVDGDTVVAVRRSGLTDQQKRELAIYDNRTAELAEWDWDQLAADKAAGLPLESWWTPNELHLPKGAGHTDPDGVPDLRPTTIHGGDEFELGAHLLVCGDCLDPAVVDRVVPVRTPAATVVTSPPYWTGQPYDEKPGLQGVQAFIEAWAATWAPRVRRRIQIQTGHSNTTLLGESGPWRKILLDSIWATALQQRGWFLRHRRIWAKGGGNLPIGPIGDLIDESWEIIATFYRVDQNEGGQERVSEGWAQMGVWADIPGVAIAGHPCPFPVAIAERMIQLYSVVGDIVAEPFCGSGTTLIACEQLQRRCCAVELSPSYCQVTIDRWEAFTGLKAMKVGDARA